MSASEPPQPRRSLRVRLARSSFRQEAVESGSDAESDSQDEYEPPRKRARSTSSEERPSTSTRRPVPSPRAARPHMRQEYPEDDPEMVPVAPHPRRATVRPSIAHPEDDRFASLRTGAQTTPHDEERREEEPRQEVSSVRSPSKQSGSTSVRERVRQAQAARQAQMEANLAWATGLGEEVNTAPDACEEAGAEPVPIRPQGSQRPGRRKLDLLRQQTSGAAAARGGQGGHSRGGLRGTRASQAVDSDRLREARELRQSEIEAKQAWASFHARQASQGNSNAGGGGQSLPSGPTLAELEAQARVDAPDVEPSPEPATASKGGHSLVSWLGLAPKESEVPEPVFCEAAQLVDRDSLFIGYVYPLESARAAEVATVLNHLAHRVHPHVPVNLLPPALRAAPPGKRGASHDMYALRVLQLRPGRTGEKGAADYSVIEETEDDGEKWGAQKVLNAMREQGIVDAICIVSRWYGGVMLGPDRFAHIHKVATHALHAFRLQEQIAPIVAQLVDLDNQLDSLRRQLSEARGAPVHQLAPSSSTAKYAHVQALDQAQRLLAARKTAVQAQARVLAKVKDQEKASISR